MVLWCRACGALIGIRYPYTDWTVDRDTLCPSCAEQEHVLAQDKREGRLSESSMGEVPEGARTLETTPGR
jgi:hypothetical protein